MAENKEQTAKKGISGEIFVKQDVTVKINGKSLQVKKGKQKVDSNIARILIDAGYADEI